VIKQRSNGLMEQYSMWLPTSGPSVQWHSKGTCGSYSSLTLEVSSFVASDTATATDNATATATATATDIDTSKDYPKTFALVDAGSQAAAYAAPTRVDTNTAADSIFVATPTAATTVVDSAVLSHNGATTDTPTSDFQPNVPPLDGVGVSSLLCWSPFE
jgi:hypothetical protein